MSEIASRVKAIIVDKLGVEESEVTNEASFTNDLGADSLDTVELIMEFEKEFGISIPDDQAEKIGTTLALLVCVKTFDKLGLSRKDILGITMPGFGTTDRTYHNAIDLMKSLGISIREISIKDACIQHFKDIDHNINVHDVTYENSQARERTQILIDTDW